MSICLVMIVKDEEDIIERALRSALPHVDSYCIVDTGSTDSTIATIKKVCEGVKGVIHERPWVNFGHNRSEALDLARPMASWSLMLDADDILHFEKPILPNNVKGMYMKIVLGSVIYRRVTLFNNAYQWKYVGAVHEYPDCPDCINIGVLPSTVWIEAHTEGARSKDPNKYVKDAELLEKEIEKDPYNTRAIFYAAQSWRDAGVPQKAKEWYIRCLESNSWVQEKYVSLLNLIRLTTDINEKYKLAWNAINICPERIEVTYELLKATREKSEWSLQAYALGLLANKQSRKPEDFLFVEQPIYDYLFDDEYSIHCYYLGYDSESARSAFRAMSNAPPAHKLRIRVNYEFALKRLN